MSLSTLFSEQGVRDTFRCLLLVLFDDVGVEGLRRADVQVAELLGDGNDVGTVGDQHRGNGMPEGVGVDVREAVTI